MTYLSRTQLIRTPPRVLTFQELGQEAVSGVDLLCRTSAEFLRELAETDIGGGGGRVLASFVRGVYRAPAGRWVPDERTDGVVRFEACPLSSLDIFIYMQAASGVFFVFFYGGIDIAAACISRKIASIPASVGASWPNPGSMFPSFILDCCAPFRPWLPPTCANRTNRALSSFL